MPLEFMPWAEVWNGHDIAGEIVKPEQNYWEWMIAKQSFGDGKENMNKKVSQDPP